MTEHQDAEWNVAAWHGKMLVDRDGEKIGKPQDVYVDVDAARHAERTPTRPSLTRYHESPRVTVEAVSSLK